MHTFPYVIVYQQDKGKFNSAFYLFIKKMETEYKE